MTGSGDSLRWPDKFYVRLGSLAYSIGGSDFPPTTQQLAVHEEFKKQLAEFKGRFDKLLEEDLQALNKMLQEKSIQNIFTK